MTIPPASILVEDKKFDFVDTPTTLQLYADSSQMFKNINADICTPTKCFLKADTPSCD